MNRIVPDDRLMEFPCSVVAVSTAKHMLTLPLYEYPVSNGYFTLKQMNAFVRENFEVSKRTDYRQGERPKLKDLELVGSAIICVLGHFIYADGTNYYSFFNNDNDDVVTVWNIKKPKENEDKDKKCLVG